MFQSTVLLVGFGATMDLSQCGTHYEIGQGKKLGARLLRSIMLVAI